MRLALDVSSLPYGTGVSRYTQNLLSALMAYSPQDSWLAYGSSLRQFRSLKRQVDKLPPALKTALYPLPPLLVANFFYLTNLPLTRLLGPIDLIHAWDWYTPNPGRAALVSTVHDLALFKTEVVAHSQIRRYHRLSLERLIKFKAWFITVSTTTKQDLIDLFAIDPERITVIPEALPKERQVTVTAATATAVLTQYRLTKPYFLFVGSLEPRKNLTRQIDAWKHFQKDYDLVIVGAQGWQAVPTQPGLHYLSAVNDHELACLYRTAQLLLYVSLYEGFGLPILEAFFYQLPVVTGNLSSMPEVGGDAVVLCQPQSVASIIQGIGQALLHRPALITRGQARLELFSWDQIAAQTYAVYQQAMAANN